jgi:hypothetical protein
MNSQHKARGLTGNRISDNKNRKQASRLLAKIYSRAAVQFLLPLLGSLTALASVSFGQGSAPPAPQYTKVDTTTSAGGVLRLLRGVLQEGSNITFAIIGTDTVRISASGTGSASIWDTSSAFPYRDTIWVRIDTAGSVDDTLIGFYKIPYSDTTVFFNSGGATSIFRMPHSLVVQSHIYTPTLRVHALYPNPNTDTVVLFGSAGSQAYPFVGNVGIPDSLLATSGRVKRLIRDSLASYTGGSDGNDTLWSAIATRDVVVYVGDKAANDTMIGITNAGAVTQLDSRTNTSFEFLDNVSMTNKTFKTNILDFVSGGALRVGLTNGDRMYYNLNAPDSLIPHIRLVRTTIRDSIRLLADYVTVDTNTSGKLRVAPQSLGKTQIDSTSSNMIFDGAFEGTSATADSQYSTQGDVNRKTPAYDTTTASGGVLDITNAVIQEGSNITFTVVGTDTIRIDGGSGGSGDNVKFDTTTASGGVVDITNPVIQEGKNITFAIVGTDTVRLDANAVWDTTFKTQTDVLTAGISGVDCVLSGLAITGGADMTPAVAKGAVLSNRIMYAVAGADITIGAADATNPRIDLIVVTSAGALAVRAGTASSKPIPPARTANDVVIGLVYVAAGVTTIPTSVITDTRVSPQYPVCIYRTTTAEVTNNTSTAIHALNKANSGVTIPDGLLLTGRKLRVRVGGNYLINSGAPTVTIAISYGGTTMFSDVSAGGTADADRSAWFCDFDIAAQANNDQALNGNLTMGMVGAKTAPAVGIGDAWTVSQQSGAIAGASAVDSDAGNRQLAVLFTFSIANAANELVVESATVELY